MNVIMIICIE